MRKWDKRFFFLYVYSDLPSKWQFNKVSYSYVYLLCAQPLTCIQLFGTPRTVARQAPLSMGFSRQQHWSELPFPPQRDLPDSGIEPTTPVDPELAGRFLTTEPPGKPGYVYRCAEHIGLIHASHVRLRLHLQARLFRKWPKWWQRSAGVYLICHTLLWRNSFGICIAFKESYTFKSQGLFVHQPDLKSVSRLLADRGDFSGSWLEFPTFIWWREKKTLGIWDILFQGVLNGSLSYKVFSLEILGFPGSFHFGNLYNPLDWK